jgi:hypothetical protein
MSNNVGSELQFVPIRSRASFRREHDSRRIDLDTVSRLDRIGGQLFLPAYRDEFPFEGTLLQLEHSGRYPRDRDVYSYR